MRPPHRDALACSPAASERVRPLRARSVLPPLRLLVVLDVLLRDAHARLDAPDLVARAGEVHARGAAQDGQADAGHHHGGSHGHVAHFQDTARLQPQLHRDEHDDGGEGGRALDEVLAAVRLEALDVLVRLRLALAHASAHNVSFPLIRIA